MPLLRHAYLCLCFWFSACSAEPVSDQGLRDKPMRIVSLDYCADQYVLKLADRAQILALSPDARKPFSHMRAAAIGLPTVRPVAEDVLTLKPDLIVRAYGGGPQAEAFFERAGIPVQQLGWASSLDGQEAGAIPVLIQDMADGFGQSERGKKLVRSYRERLKAVKPRQADQSALYMTPGGVTSGPGSLAHDMLVAAGLNNYETVPGWRPLPLERLAYEQPDLIAAAFFETPTQWPDAWSASRHPIAQTLLKGPDQVPLQGAWTACGGWFILEAIEALAGNDMP